MFTGIVQGIAEVKAVEGNDELQTFIIQFPKDFCQDLTRGASIAINGVCLTATSEIAADIWSLDVMLKTLRMTNLGSIKQGHRVNVERAAKEGAEIGGHPLSGHIDFTAPVLKVTTTKDNKLIRFALPKNFTHYLFPQGYIAVDGASLTISDLSKPQSWFEVWLIPETRKVTILNDLCVGDHVNVEIDRGTQVIVDTIQQTINDALEKRFALLEAALMKLGISANDLLADIDPPMLLQTIKTKEAPPQTPPSRATTPEDQAPQ